MQLRAVPAKGTSPFSERLVFGVCNGFALWTLCSHAVVLAGGTLGGLIGVFAFAASVVATGAYRFRDRVHTYGADAPEPPLRRSLTPARYSILAVAWVCAAFAPSFLGAIALWALLVVVLAVAAWFWIGTETPFTTLPDESRNLELGLFALGFACAAYGLIVHRPDADDAFYINLAVAAVDHPELPLLARDTLHGLFDLPIHLATYRVHSFELLNGAVSWLTGFPAIRVFHWGATTVGSFFVPLAFAALFRRLTPKYWLWATLALVVVLAAPGETHRWYGNFAFVRIWQGKGIFLFVFLPLIWLAGIRFAREPDLRGWLCLASAQIAALGCSANALWAAPVAAVIGMSTSFRPSLGDLRIFGVGLIASLYLIVAGLIVKSSTTASIPELNQTFASGEQLQYALNVVFGRDRLYLFGVGTIFVAWSAAPGNSLGRRFALIAPLAVLLVLFNPFLDSFVRSNFTGASYWRIAWALPAPVLMTLVLIAPLRLTPRLGVRSAQALTVVFIALFAIAIPRYSGFSTQNGVRVSIPTLKVPNAYLWAASLNQIAPNKSVVAPPAVSTWVPTFHDSAYPMEVRFYLKHLRDRLSDIAFRDRQLMTRFVDGHADQSDAAQIFERGLDLYEIEAVCLRHGATLESARKILRRAGFHRRIPGSDAEIWARS